MPRVTTHPMRVDQDYRTEADARTRLRYHVGYLTEGSMELLEKDGEGTYHFGGSGPEGDVLGATVTTKGTVTVTWKDSAVLTS